MGTIWVKEFTGGLDSRRMSEATSGGVLVVANNGHVTRGGEFEQRAAFVPTYTLPAGTVGLFYTRYGIYVFGHGAAPVMPSGVTYQRLQHSTPATALVRILSADLYQNKIYAVAEFADGAIFHFYDGARVTDWFDGRARTSFSVSGTNTPAVASIGKFSVTGGTLGGGNQVTNVLIDGVDVLGVPVAHTGDNTTTAAAVAAQITAFNSAPNYTATSLGIAITISASIAGALPNGKIVTPTPGGTVTVGSILNMADGAEPIVSTLATLTVNGVAIIDTPIAWGASAEATAAALVSEINSFVSSPEYVATANGGMVNVIASASGEAANGFVVAMTGANGFSISPSAPVLANGGVSTGSSAVGSFVVGAGTALSTIVPVLNGVNLTSAPVVWNTNATTTAAAIAAAINSATTVPDYTATSLGTRVTVVSVDHTAVVNGLSITFTVVGTFPTSSVIAMAGGSVDDAFTPGTFVKTIGTKMYSVSGPAMHFSGIREPTLWTTDAVGAGFIDMSSESSGSEVLTALARYQNLVAVFAERLVQIWYVDPDPELNRHTQILNNTGTASPKSVTAFGDVDLFYLDESGPRSLRARDSSNAASTTDIGVPVDSLVIEKLATFTNEDRREIAGLIEPANGRFWLIMKDRVFVFSFFSGAKVSAWSTYDTSYIDGAGATVVFEVDESVVFNRRVYLRSGNTIYVYGGLEGATVYDATVAEAWLPYMDAGEPARRKQFAGIDAAIRGLWTIYGALDPTNEDAEDEIATISRSTFNHDKVPFAHEATHVSLRFRSKGTGPHRLGSCVIHYEGNADED